MIQTVLFDWYKPRPPDQGCRRSGQAPAWSQKGRPAGRIITIIELIIHSLATLIHSLTAQFRSHCQKLNQHNLGVCHMAGTMIWSARQWSRRVRDAVSADLPLRWIGIIRGIITITIHCYKHDMYHVRLIFPLFFSCPAHKYHRWTGRLRLF